MSEPVGEGTPTELDDPVESAGGSAPPDAPGPGSASATATAFTGAAQTAANDVIDGLQGFANHVFDVGEAGLQDALKVVDAAQTGLSNVTSVITAKITAGKAELDLPTIPTAGIAGELTGDAQKYANKALNGLQVLTNEAYDLGEEGLEEALKVVDEAQQLLTGTFSKVTNIAAGRISGTKKG